MNYINIIISKYNLFMPTCNNIMLICNIISQYTRSLQVNMRMLHVQILYLHVGVGVYHHAPCMLHFIFSHNYLVSLDGLLSCGNSILTLTSIVASAVVVLCGSVLNYMCWRHNKSTYTFDENISYI